MKRTTIIARAASVAALAAAICASVAWASGTPDQVNDPEWASGWLCELEGADRLYAGFTPTRRLLSAFSVRVVKRFNFPAEGLTLTGRVRVATGTGSVLGTATAVVPYAGEARPLVTFDFTPSLVLEPEGMFVFELANDVSGVRWLGALENPYPRGHSFDCDGVTAMPSHDFNFISYVPADGSAPDTTLTPNPRAASVTRSRRAVVEFTATDDLTYASNLVLNCKLDGSAHTPCTSPVSLESLADGRHTFAVTATDDAGQTDATPAIMSWTVDGTAPTRPQVIGPRRPSRARATYRFVARDSVDRARQLKFRCALDSRRLRPCSNRIARRISKGRHVLRVIAIDRAGNLSPVAAVQIARP
jgi:hypothetical protein